MAVSAELESRIEGLREDLLDLFASQRGIAIESWWLRRRQIRTILGGIVKEPPTEHPECGTYRGPNGEHCGCFRGKWKPRRRKCRGRKQSFRNGYYYPRFRIRLPGSERVIGKGGESRPKDAQVQLARVLLALKYGAMPSNMVAGHTCPCGENELCLNLEHLVIMTPLENFLRIRLNGHADPHLLGMIDSSTKKFSVCPESLTEQELRLFVAVQMKALEVTWEGEIVTHNLVEEMAKEIPEPVLEPDAVPF